MLSQKKKMSKKDNNKEPSDEEINQSSDEKLRNLIKSLEL